MSVWKSEHYHVWSRTYDGTEMANAIYENPYDAAVSFCAMGQQVIKYNEHVSFTIEDVVGSLDAGAGMWAGAPGWMLVISKCDGGCRSPVWN